MRKALSLLGVGLAVTALGIVTYVYRAPTQDAVKATVVPPIPADLSRTDAALVELVTQTRSRVIEAPGDSFRWLELGMVYEANESEQLALECYEQAVKLDEQCARCWYRLALTRMTLNEHEPAIEAMRRSISLRGDYAPAYWNLGYWYLDQGNLEDADTYFSTSAQLAPRDPAGWFGLARLRMLQGRNDEAIRIMEDVRSWTPVNRAYAQQLLGTAYRRVGRLEDAELALAGAADGVDTWDDPWTAELNAYSRGLIWKVRLSADLLSKGQVDEAIDRLTGFLRDDPDNADLLGNLAIAYRHKGQLDQSIQTLQRALTLRPSLYKGHFNLGLACFMLAQQTLDPREAADLIRLADEHADRALSLNPSYTSAHGLKGQLQEHRGELDEALSEYSLAAKDQERGRDWLMRRTRLLAGLNRWEDTIETLEELMSRYEPLPDDMFGLLLAQGNAGRADDAVQTANRFLQRWPNDARSGQIRQVLQSYLNNRTIGPKSKEEHP